MKQHFQKLGMFSEIVAQVKQHQALFPKTPLGKETQQRIREVLGFWNKAAFPRDGQRIKAWEKDEVAGEPAARRPTGASFTRGRTNSISRYKKPLFSGYNRS